jgi:hypothetical protein
MPPFCTSAEIHLDIAAPSQQNIFTLGISKSSPVLKQIGRAAGKNPVLKSSSEEKRISWLDDVQLRC